MSKYKFQKCPSCKTKETNLFARDENNNLVCSECGYIKIKANYYALWDLQLNNYLNTGLNSRSIKELKDAFLDYISIDFEDWEKDYKYYSKMTINELADMWEFRVESSRKPFNNY